MPHSSDTLAEVIEPAVTRGEGVQKVLTRWRERAKFQAIDVAIRDLAPTDMRRAAWVNLDRFSTVWVSAWPNMEFQFSNPEFREVATFYFGLPSPACAARVGERIGNSREVLDAYGNRLTTLALPGDGWRTQHDAIKWRLVQDAREMHVRMRHEVYGLFAECIPQQGRREADAMPLRKRQGLVPDYLVHVAIDGPERPMLLELKTLHFGTSTYTAAAERCRAVARRADAVPGEYAAKAREIDRRFCGTPRGVTGPVERKLQTYEPVRGIVFGAWAEASPVTESLLQCLALTGAQRHWQGMRCPAPPQAAGALAWLLRRRWGLTALREHARLKLDRLEYVGRGAVAAAQRRAATMEAHAARARALAGSLVSGPRARFPRR